MSRLGLAIERLQAAERELARELREVGERHAAEPDVLHTASTLAELCEGRAERLCPFAERYKAARDEGGPGLLDSLREQDAALLDGGQPDGLALLGDLRGLFASAQGVVARWTMVEQGAHAKRDAELLAACTECRDEAAVVAQWLLTRMKEVAPQALTARPLRAARA